MSKLVKLLIGGLLILLGIFQMASAILAFSPMGLIIAAVMLVGGVLLFRI